MKSISTIRPDSFSIENCDGIAEVVLYENIEEITENEETYYKYDEYRLNTPYRDNLESEITSNREAWLNMAITNENCKNEKKSLVEEVAALKTENEIISAALEEVISVIAGGDL